jgi:hypothetical protein
MPSVECGERLGSPRNRRPPGLKRQRRGDCRSVSQRWCSTPPCWRAPPLHPLPLTRCRARSRVRRLLRRWRSGRPGRGPSRGSLLSWRKRERQTPRSSRRCSFVPRSATPDGRSRRLTRPRLRHFAVLHCPNAHATMSGNSSRQNASPCDPTRSVMTTSAPAPRRAVAHRVAFSRKKGSDVPATR